VRKHGRGVYVYLKYVGDGALVSELERNLRLQDAVLKLQTVKLGKAAADGAAKPEDIEFEHLDVIEQPEPEDSLAKTRGLEDVREDYHRREAPADDADDADDDVPDLGNNVSS
jgi:small subunit ribosomal protein S6